MYDIQFNLSFSISKRMPL